MILGSHHKMYAFKVDNRNELLISAHSFFHPPISPSMDEQTLVCRRTSAGQTHMWKDGRMSGCMTIELTDKRRNVEQTNGRRMRNTTAGGRLDEQTDNRQTDGWMN